MELRAAAPGRPTPVEGGGEDGLVAGQEHPDGQGENRAAHGGFPEQGGAQGGAQHHQKGHGGEDQHRGGQHGAVYPVLHQTPLPQGGRLQPAWAPAPGPAPR